LYKSQNSNETSLGILNGVPKNPAIQRGNSTKAQNIAFPNSSYRLANRLNGDLCSIDAVYFFDDGKATLLNPVYMPDKDAPILKIYDQVANIRLWSFQYIGDAASKSEAIGHMSARPASQSSYFITFTRRNF